MYLSPLVERWLHVSPRLFMRGVGVVEMVVGLLVLSGRTRVGGYIVMAWLLGIVVNLLTTGMFYDLAVLVAACTAAPLAVAAEETTWSNVPVVDTMCISKVKANPDAHKRSCALQCSKSGYGLITTDGAYLKFDAAGNEKTVAALKASKKEDHVRATVRGTKEGDTIKVDSVTID